MSEYKEVQCEDCGVKTMVKADVEIDLPICANCIERGGGLTLK